MRVCESGKAERVCSGDMDGIRGRENIGLTRGREMKSIILMKRNERQEEGG